MPILVIMIASTCICCIQLSNPYCPHIDNLFHIFYRDFKCRNEKILLHIFCIVFSPWGTATKYVLHSADTLIAKLAKSMSAMTQTNENGSYNP